ncbi:MAG: 50S ribosomal protein L21 [Candidatus Cloacimonadota bacterium]|nr:50S ribosomal protein L21 [Candidatus Cloacimonadota bacterium]
MYAIVDYKGTQFRVEKDMHLDIPFLGEETNPGDKIKIEKVLLVDNNDDIKVGTPLVENASVSAEIIEHGKDSKIIVFKKKRRKGYAKKQGHRQQFTKIKVNEINI